MTPGRGGSTSAAWAPWSTSGVQCRVLLCACGGWGRGVQFRGWERDAVPAAPTASTPSPPASAASARGGGGDGGEGMKEKNRFCETWASYHWLCVQNFIFPQRNFFSVWVGRWFGLGEGGVRQISPPPPAAVHKHIAEKAYHTLRTAEASRPDTVPLRPREAPQRQ